MGKPEVFPEKTDGFFGVRIRINRAALISFIASSTPASSSSTVSYFTIIFIAVTVVIAITLSPKPFWLRR